MTCVIYRSMYRMKHINLSARGGNNVKITNKQKSIGSFSFMAS